MYPVLSVTSNPTVSGGAQDSEDNGGNKGGTLQGSDLQQVEVTASTTTVVNGVSTSSKCKSKVYAKKLVASIAVSSPATTDKGVNSRSGIGRISARKSAAVVGSYVFFGSLGVVLSPEIARKIEDLFCKMGVFARRTYKNMVAKQLPSGVSDKLTPTGRAIWYFTYRVMCEGSFVSRCIGEYHCKYRHDFIRSLSNIRVLSNSSGSDVVPLTGNMLLDFLSRLDCAINDEVKSVFDSCWSEVCVTLEEESLTTVSCKDFVDVLKIADIPPLASSAIRERNKGIGKCTTSGISVTGLTHSLPSSSQSLSLQSNPELSSRAHSQPESQLSSSLSLREEAPGTSSEVDFDDGSSSNKCVDLLGARLHPDSAKLVLQLLCDIEKSFNMSFSCSMRYYILEALDSELSVVEKAIWCIIYREQHLYRFMHRSICIYHAKYRPKFIRALDGFRVLSSSSDHRLVPLIGGELLSFLSELDCAAHKKVEYIFDSLWDEITDTVFAELEDGSLGDVSCEDFIRVLDVAGIPVAAFSIYQVRSRKSAQACVKRRAERCVISKRKTSKSSSKRRRDKGSVVDTTDLTHSSVASLSQLQSQPESSLTLVTESVAIPTVSDQSGSVSAADAISISVVLPGAESPSVTEFVAMLIISGDVLVSVAEDVASDLVVEGELSVEPSSSFLPLPAPASDLVVASDISPPLSPSAKELVAADVVSPFMGAEDDSLSSPSSPSIEPSSSSLSLSSSPSSSGLDADISFSSSSPESPVSAGEVE
ncbi:hypothetical protein, partial [Candidatus Ichthyocystis sparus]